MILNNEYDDLSNAQKEAIRVAAAECGVNEIDMALVAIDAHRSFAGYLQDTIRALARFGDALYASAATEYLREFGRLPGSDRTARLRKKRRSKVIGWYAGQLEGA